MQPQRQTMTDRLADVIHIVQFGNKSGVLTVERGDGVTREEGYITFVTGRIVEARVGQQSGLAAFNYLTTWQACLFTLVIHNRNEVAYVQLPSPKGSMPDSAPATRTPVVYNPSIQNSASRNGTGARPYPPQRLQRGEETILYPAQLSRVHRRLLMLIDGRRGLDDLARLLGRSRDEVQELLNDLVRGGLIWQ